MLLHDNHSMRVVLLVVQAPNKDLIRNVVNAHCRVKDALMSFALLYHLEEWLWIVAADCLVDRIIPEMVGLVKEDGGSPPDPLLL